MNKDWTKVEDGLPDYDKKVLVFGEAKGANPSMGGAYIMISERQDLRKTPLAKEANRIAFASSRTYKISFG